MRKCNRFQLATLGMLAAALLTPQIGLADGRLVDISGEVHIVENGRKKPARVGDTISSGAKVQTGKFASAELLLTDKSVVRLGSLSSMTADSLAQSGKTTLKLAFGWLKSFVTKVSDGTSFQVRTASAVAGVRGTVFDVTVDEDGQTEVRCFEGEVAVNAIGNTGDDPQSLLAGAAMSVDRLGTMEQRSMGAEEMESNSAATVAKSKSSGEGQGKAAAKATASATATPAARIESPAVAPIHGAPPGGTRAVINANIELN